MAKDKGKILNNGRFMTPKFRFNYPKVCTRIPADAEYDAGRFTIQAVWDDKADLSILKALVDDCAKKAGYKKGYKSPFKDGEDKGYDEGTVISNLKSFKNRPVTLWADKTPVESDDDLVPGSYAVAIVSAYAYDSKGNKGVLLSLDSIQFLGGGKRFVGGAAAAVSKQAQEEFEVGEIEETEETLDDEDDEDIDM